MSLTLHYHPLASFCWKALIALYENETPTPTWWSRSAKTCKNVTAYVERLKARPSIARVLREAEPYFKMVPS